MLHIYAIHLYYILNTDQAIPDIIDDKYVITINTTISNRLKR